MLTSSRIARTLTALATTAVLAACAGQPAPSPTSAVPNAFPHAARAQAPTATELPGDGRWWRLFEDTGLEALIATAERGNLGLRQAGARLAQARALSQVARSQAAVQLNGTASAGRQQGPLINAAGGNGNLYQLGGQLSWELDVVGKLSALQRAAEFDVRGQALLLDSIRLLAATDVAQAYLAWQCLTEESRLLQASAQAQRAALQLAESRVQSGLAAPADTLRARSELADLRLQINDLSRRIALQENLLAHLTGEPPGGVTAPLARGLPKLPEIAAGLPVRLLARRPDIAAGQARVQASHARLDVAKTAWLPSLQLTAIGGLASGELGELLRASARGWGLGALLGLSLLDGGRRAATVDHSQAGAELAALEYQDLVLTALREVDDQLTHLAHAREQAQLLEEAITAAQEALRLLESRYRSGLVSQVEVIDAQRTVLRHRRSAVQLHAARAASTVTLIRALGGGWQPSPDAARQPGSPPSASAPSALMSNFSIR